MAAGRRLRWPRRPSEWNGLHLRARPAYRNFPRATGNKPAKGGLKSQNQLATSWEKHLLPRTLPPNLADSSDYLKVVAKVRVKLPRPKPLPTYCTLMLICFFLAS